MTIKTDSWHYKWYAYWLTHGRGNTPAYKENFCHYVRVLMFWAPITWIDQHTFWDWEKLTMRTMIGVFAVSMLGWIGLMVTVAAMTQTTKFLMAIGSLGGLLGIIGCLILLVKTMRGKKLEIPGTVKLVGSYAIAKKRRICPFIDFEERNEVTV